MRLWVVACTLLATGLAGCSEAGTEDDGQGAADGPEQLTTGFLRGVVIDEAVRPLGSAVVTILQNDTEQAILTTDADGNWGVGGLDGGDYVVNVTKPGFTPKEVPATVVAGEQTPDLIEITLAAVPVDSSFVWPIVWEGQVTCGTTAQNWCAAANFVAGAQLFEDRSFRFLFDDFMAYQRTPDFLQAEFLWDPNTPASAWAYSAFWASTWDEWDECLCTPNIFGVVEGDGYMLVQADRGPLEELDVGFSRGVGVGFSAGQGGLDDITANPERTTIMINQPFEAFFHVFYGCVPPEGWLFSVDGDPVCDPDTTRPPIPYEILQAS